MVAERARKRDSRDLQSDLQMRRAARKRVVRDLDLGTRNCVGDLFSADLHRRKVTRVSRTCAKTANHARHLPRTRRKGLLILGGLTRSPREVQKRLLDLVAKIPPKGLLDLVARIPPKEPLDLVARIQPMGLAHHHHNHHNHHSTTSHHLLDLTHMSPNFSKCSRRRCGREVLAETLPTGTRPPGI